MPPVGPDAILAVLLIVCRIGACLMLMPGFSSARVPMQVRLFLTLGASLALAPLLLPAITPALAGADLGRLAGLIVLELMIGGQIGLVGRIFYLALQTLAHASTMFIGFGGMPGAPVEDAEPLPSLATLLTLAATALIFVSDLHWEVFRGLVASYRVLPVLSAFNPQAALIQVADRLGEAFILALRIASPFVVFAVIVNLALGLMNKLVQQIPVFFIATPIVLMAGLFVVYFLSREFLALFHAGFSAWLVKG